MARFFAVGEPEHELALEHIFDDLVGVVVERNFDLYEVRNGRLRPRRR